MSLWDTVKGSPPNLKGENPFAPYIEWFYFGQVFTHFTPARQRYSPTERGYPKHDNIITIIFLGKKIKKGITGMLH